MKTESKEGKTTWEEGRRSTEGFRKRHKLYKSTRQRTQGRDLKQETDKDARKYTLRKRI